jgi:hypothetical protein
MNFRRPFIHNVQTTPSLYFMRFPLQPFFTQHVQLTGISSCLKRIKFSTCIRSFQSACIFCYVELSKILHNTYIAQSPSLFTRHAAVK